MLGIPKQWFGWRFAKIFLSAIPVAVLLFYLFIWRLGTLVPGFSVHEAEAINFKGSASFFSIRHDPLNAPHAMLQLLFQHFGHHGAFWMRSVSVFFAFIFLLALFLLLRKWFGNFIGGLGTTLAASTPWVIILARSASSDIMFLSPILIILTFTIFTHPSKKPRLAWYALILCSVLAIYTPGVVWFIVIGFLMGYHKLVKPLSSISTPAAISGFVMFFLLLTPLMFSFYQTPALAKDWLLIPHLLPSVSTTTKSGGWALATLFYRARQHFDYLVGRLPILSIIQSILTAIGLYAMIKNAKREAFMLLILLVIAIVGASLNTNMALLTLCLPALAVFDTAALRYLYRRWLNVFPQNPFPRIFATVLICLLVTLQVAYGARYSLVAWPHSLQTRKIYVIK